MSRFSNASIEAAMEGEHVPFAVACALDFASGMVRAHMGGGELVIDGQTYLGVGSVGSGGFGAISPIIERPDARDYTALKLSLSGVSPDLVGKIPDRSEYRGRYGAIYFLPVDSNYQLITPIEPQRAEGFMDTLSYERKQGSATLQLTLKSLDSVFQQAVGLLYTTEHQVSLGFTTDRFFDPVPSIQNKEIYWGGRPVFAGSIIPGGGGGPRGRPK